MRTASKDIIIYPREQKLIFYSICSLIFVFLFVTLIFYKEVMNTDYKALIYSCIGVPFFSFSFIYCIYRILKPKASVIINSEGIFDNSSAIGVGMIRWEEISGIFVYEFKFGNVKQRFLGIIPRDIDSILKRQSLFKKIIINMNIFMYTTGLAKAPLNISETSISVTADELYEQIISLGGSKGTAERCNKAGVAQE